MTIFLNHLSQPFLSQLGEKKKNIEKGGSFVWNPDWISATNKSHVACVAFIIAMYALN